MEILVALSCYAFKRLLFVKQRLLNTVAMNKFILLLLT